MLRESGIFEREEVRRWVKCAEMCALAENVQREEVAPGLFVMRGRSSLLHGHHGHHHALLVDGQLILLGGRPLWGPPDHLDMSGVQEVRT